MKTVLQIIEEAGGLATFTWTRIENPPFMLLVIESLPARRLAAIATLALSTIAACVRRWSIPTSIQIKIQEVASNGDSSNSFSVQ